MQEFLKKRLGYIKLNFKLLYFILFDSDLKMHGSKKIFFFFFVPVLLCESRLIWSKNICKKHEIHKNKYSYFLFLFQNVEFVKNKFPRKATKTPFAKINSRKNL